MENKINIDICLLKNSLNYKLSVSIKVKIDLILYWIALNVF